MIFRPQGLIPSRRRAAEFKDRRRGGDRWSVTPTRGGSATAQAAEAAAADPREPLLEVDHVTLRFGGVVALNEVTFTIHKGEILGLIGPNGAGKTTCFNAMTGVYQPDRGRDPVRGRADHRQEAAPDHPDGHRAHVPEHPAVPRDDRAGERAWSARTRTTRRACCRRCSGCRGTGARSATGRERPSELLRFVGIQRPAGRGGPQPLVRRAAPAGDRPGAGDRPEAALPGRAGGRLQPGGEGGAARSSSAGSATPASRCC